MTRVKHLMSRQVVTIGADGSCHDAIVLMARDRIRHLPVVDEDGRLCGIVTDRDLRHRLFEPQVFRAIGTVPVERLLADTPVREVMSAPVVGIDAEADVAAAAEVMRARGVGGLPVLQHGRIVGIVTETDLLRRIVGDDSACIVDGIVSFP